MREYADTDTMIRARAYLLDFRSVWIHYSDLYCFLMNDGGFLTKGGVRTAMKKLLANGDVECKSDGNRSKEWRVHPSARAHLEISSARYRCSISIRRIRPLSLKDLLDRMDLVEVRNSCGMCPGENCDRVKGDSL